MWSNDSKGWHSYGHGQEDPGSPQGLEKKVLARRKRRARMSPAWVAVPRHDREALAAGKALLAGVRILSGVCRHGTSRVRTRQDTKAQV